MRGNRYLSLDLTSQAAEILQSIRGGGRLGWSSEPLGSHSSLSQREGAYPVSRKWSLLRSAPSPFTAFPSPSSSFQGANFGLLFPKPLTLGPRVDALKALNTHLQA